MKRVVNLLTIVLISLLVTTVSCKTSSLTLTVMEPADITVPAKIQTIAIVNRSLPVKENKIWNFLEGFFTNEGVFVDRASSEACINGAVNQLRNLPRYKEVKTVGNLDLRGAGSGVFSEPLAWSKVEQICKANNVNALITLEVFDSDIYYSKGSEVRTKKENDKEVKYTVFWKAMEIDVKAGWRIYDPVTKKIIDESIFTDRKRFSAEGPTEEAAARNLPIVEQAIQDAGYFAGGRFAFRISPSWINVSRVYYKKGTTDFGAAKRYVQADNWEQAIAIWEKYTTNPDADIAGRACYNMAVGMEVTGYLNDAVKWAEKSFTQYGNKKARNYLYQLQERVEKQKLIDKQLENK